MRHIPYILAIVSGLSACATVPKTCRSLPVDGLATIGLPNGRSAIVSDRLDRASVAELQCGADQGIRAAQVALAKRYEDGTGVPQDIAHAVRLYETAAVAVPANTAIYSPPVKLGGSGQVILVPNTSAGPGSAEAKYRLGRLLIEGRGVASDPSRGRRLISEAARQGFEPAQSYQTR